MMRFKRGRGWRPSSGFTLIEMAIAIVVFSVILLGVGGLIGTMAAATADGRNRTTQAFLMQRQIERLQETQFMALANGTFDSTIVDPGTGATTATFRTQWNVTQLVPGRLAQVDLTVRRIPMGPGGAERAVRLFLAERNP